MSVHIPRIVSIVLYGTSLTTGRLSGQWDRKLEAGINAKANRRVKVFSHGKGSQTSTWAVDNMQNEVLRFNPDIIGTEGFSINDAAAGLFPGGMAGHEANLDILLPAFVASGADVTIHTMSPGPGRPLLNDMYDMDMAKAIQYGIRAVDNRPNWPAELTAQMTYDGDTLHPNEEEVTARILPGFIAHYVPIVNAIQK